MTARNAIRKAWRFLTLLDLAATLIAILLLLIALGSCFPQLSSSIAADTQQSASWEADVRARYGSLTDVLAAIGTFRWYRSPAFWACLTLLALATLVCTLDRWGALWRRAFRSRAVSYDRVFETAPHSVKLDGLQAAEVSHRAHECLKERGFRVRSETTGNILHLRGERNRLAPLATLVTHLAVLFLLLGTILSSTFGWRQELRLEPHAITEVVHESQLALRNEGFTIDRYPDGSVADYQAHVAVTKEDREVMRGNVRVNQPMAYHGIGFYLHGYEENAGDYSLTLLAVRDPGYGLVIAAGFLLLFGLTVSFNFPRCWIQARIEPEGTLYLAGWAERRACDFGREFRVLVEELENWKNGRLEAGDKRIQPQ
jgi:cytochrome c biogenesis protein ResB